MSMSTPPRLDPQAAAAFHARSLEEVSRCLAHRHGVPISVARPLVAYLFQVEINGMARSTAKESLLNAALLAAKLNSQQGQARGADATRASNTSASSEGQHA